MGSRIQYFVSIGALTVINFLLGIKAQAIIDIITDGLEVFG